MAAHKTECSARHVERLRNVFIEAAISRRSDEARYTLRRERRTAGRREALHLFETGEPQPLAACHRTHRSVTSNGRYCRRRISRRPPGSRFHGLRRCPHRGSEASSLLQMHLSRVTATGAISFAGWRSPGFEAGPTSHRNRR